MRARRAIDPDEFRFLDALLGEFILTRDDLNHDDEVAEASKKMFLIIVLMGLKISRSPTHVSIISQKTD
jgi:hypothetical protein